MVKKNLIIDLISEVFPVHIKTRYCKLMKRKNKCMTTCEASRGCKLYSKFQEIVKNANYKETGTRVEEKALEDFNDFFNGYIDTIVKLQRADGVDKIIGNLVLNGATYKLNQEFSNFYFADKYNINVVDQMLYVKVLGLDTDTFGDIWLRHTDHPKVDEYQKRISVTNSRISLIGKVYSCEILVKRPIGLFNNNTEPIMDKLGEDLVHKIEIFDQERYIYGN